MSCLGVSNRRTSPISAAKGRACADKTEDAVHQQYDGPVDQFHFKYTKIGLQSQFACREKGESPVKT